MIPRTIWVCPVDGCHGASGEADDRQLHCCDNDHGAYVPAKFFSEAQVYQLYVLAKGWHAKSGARFDSRTLMELEQEMGWGVSSDDDKTSDQVAGS